MFFEENVNNGKRRWTNHHYIHVSLTGPLGCRTNWMNSSIIKQETCQYYSLVKKTNNYT